MAENSDKREDPGLKQDDSGRPKRKPGLNIFQIGLIIMLAVIMLSIFLTKKQNEASYNEFREHLADDRLDRGFHELLDIAVNEEFVEPTIEAIIRGGRSGPEGNIGDGKIFVQPLEDVIRIRTGERGSEAI